MKRSRFTEEKIIEILRLHAAGAKAAEFCREHGISQATLYNSRKRTGSLRSCWPKRCWTMLP